MESLITRMLKEIMVKGQKKMCEKRPDELTL